MMRFQLGWLTLVLLTMLISSGDIEAQVILDDLVIFDGIGTESQTLALTQSIPFGEGAFLFDLQFQGGNDFGVVSGSIAEFIAIFEANEGDLVSENFPAADLETSTNAGPNFLGSQTGSLFTFEPNETRFFGYWDDRSFDGTSNSSDNYGWAEITRVGDRLVLDQSVTAIGSPIIVGSLTAVPEPSSALFMLMTIGIAGLRRKRC